MWGAAVPTEVWLPLSCLTVQCSIDQCVGEPVSVLLYNKCQQVRQQTLSLATLFRLGHIDLHSTRVHSRPPRNQSICRTVAFMHLSDVEEMVPISCRQEVTACFTSASVASRARNLVRKSSKEMDIPGRPSHCQPDW